MLISKGRSKIKIDPSKLTKRIQGLFRINSDLLAIKQIIEAILNKETSEHNHFDDYQGILILYRKCFNKTSDLRGTSLTEKHLKNVTPEQKEFHLRLIDLADKHVAHSEEDAYDSVEVSIIIDNATGRPMEIEVLQTIYEPLSCNDFKLFETMIELLMINLSLEVKKIKERMLSDYNIKLHDKKQETQIFSVHNNPKKSQKTF